MSRVLVKVNIPHTVKNQFGFDDTFDVPFTKEGLDLVDWWKKAELEERISVLQKARDGVVPITEALKDHLANADQ